MQPAMSLLHEPELSPEQQPQSEPEQAAPELPDHEQPQSESEQPEPEPELPEQQQPQSEPEQQATEPERGLLDFPSEVLARILGFAAAAHPGEGLPVDAATLSRSSRMRPGFATCWDGRHGSTTWKPSYPTR